VKPGALEGSSFATITLLTSGKTQIAKVSVPEGLSTHAILEGNEMKRRLPQIRAMVAPDEDPVLMIEKSWSTEELDGREVLEVLSEAYGTLADFVLNAHLTIGNLGCMPVYDRESEQVHRDFPLLYDRNGALRCMMHQATERSDFFRLSTLEMLIPKRISQELDIQPWQVLERFGFDMAKGQPAFEHLDPVAFAERIVYTSRKVLRKDRNHDRIVWLRGGWGDWYQITVVAANRAEKHLAMNQLSDLVREIGCDAFMEVGEVWNAQPGSLYWPGLTRIYKILPGAEKPCSFGSRHVTA